MVQDLYDDRCSQFMYRVGRETEHHLWRVCCTCALDELLCSMPFRDVTYNHVQHWANGWQQRVRLRREVETKGWDEEATHSCRMEGHATNTSHARSTSRSRTASISRTTASRTCSLTRSARQPTHSKLSMFQELTIRSGRHVRNELRKARGTLLACLF